MADVPSNLIPVSITELEPIPVASENALIPVSYGGVSYQVRAGDLLQVTGVLPSRQVNTDAPLTGGGALSSNLNLSIAPGGITPDFLAITGVTPGTYGDSGNVPVVTINEQGLVTAATVATIPAPTPGPPGEGVPTGGTTGQVLTKASNADFDTEWTDTAGSGDVIGPSSSVVGEIPVYGDTTGKLIGNSSAKITTSTVFPDTTILENAVEDVDNSAIQTAFYTKDGLGDPILANTGAFQAGADFAQSYVFMYDATYSTSPLSNVSAYVARNSGTNDTAAQFQIEAVNNSIEKSGIYFDIQKYDDGNATVAVSITNTVDFSVGDLPSYILSLSESGAIGVNGTYGTPGQVLTSAGDSTIATWSDPQITVSATAPGSPVVNQLWLDISGV